MEIESFRHKALGRFFVSGNAKGLDAQAVPRLRKMLALIDASSTFDMLAIPPNYGLHRLTGDLAGRWSMTVTRNWRLTFAVIDATTVAAIDLEDYH